MVTEPVTGLWPSWPDGGLTSRSCRTHGQPTSWPVRVTVPRAGSVPRLTGEAPVVTSAASPEPAGDSACTSIVTRMASPVSTTGGGAGGSSLRATVAGGALGKPGSQLATWANRCGYADRGGRDQPFVVTADRPGGDRERGEREGRREHDRRADAARPPGHVPDGEEQPEATAAAGPAESAPAGQRQ